MAKRSGKRKGGTKVVIGGKAPRGRAGGLEPAKPIGNGKPLKVREAKTPAEIAEVQTNGWPCACVQRAEDGSIKKIRMNGEGIFKCPDCGATKAGVEKIEAVSRILKEERAQGRTGITALQRKMGMAYTEASQFAEEFDKLNAPRPVSEVEAKPAPEVAGKIPVGPAPATEPSAEEIERLRHLPPEAVKSILANQRRVRLATIAEMEAKEAHKTAKGELEAAQSEQSAIIVRWFGPKSDAPLFDSVDKPAAAGVVGAAAVEDDAWKLVPVENLTIEDEKSGNRKPFPDGLLETMRENGLHTAGDISEAQAKGTGWHRKLNGIGDAKAAQIEDAMTFLFAERSRAMKAAKKDELRAAGDGADTDVPEVPAPAPVPQTAVPEPDAEWPGDDEAQHQNDMADDAPPPDSGDSDEEGQ